MAAVKTQIVRVLQDTEIHGVNYKVNTPLEVPLKMVDGLSAGGLVDPHPDAVAYVVDDLGLAVVKHVALSEEVTVPPVADSAAE